MAWTTCCPERPDLGVGKIVAVGRNYALHAAEMGAERPVEPILFLKPPTSLFPSGGELRLPPWTREVHHEVEMVVRIGRTGRNLPESEAGGLVDAVAVGLDLTARDRQAEAKKRGEPWAVSKGFDGAAPLSGLHPAEGAAGLGDLELVLEVNGARRQHGRTRDMLWPVPALLAFISTRFTLEPGDLVFTGTPSGVGPLAPGDRVAARLGDLASLEIRIAPAG